MSYRRTYVSYLTNSSYFKYIFYGLIIVAGIASFFGLRYYAGVNAQTAQKVYAETAYQYSKGVQGFRGAWEDLEFIARIGYERHRSSTFGPYFLALQAESLIHQHKLDQALELMDEMIKQLSETSPLYFVYKTKAALMRLDSKNKTVQDKGLKELAEISDAINNKNADQALYYMGLYYWITGNTAKAKEYWGLLLTRYGSYTDLKKSPWAERAQHAMQDES
jgi:tetratricopeptide (TPR) repeat protein